MYKLNIMDAMTSEERKIYNEIAKNRGKKDYDLTETKQRLRDEIKKNSKRVIENNKERGIYGYIKVFWNVAVVCSLCRNGFYCNGF